MGVSKFLWPYLRKDFQKYMASEQSTPVSHSTLIKRMIDTEGVQYYGFPDGMALPVERLGKMKEYLMYMSAGLSQDELNKLLDVMDGCLTEGIMQKKNAAKIAAAIGEIKRRQNMVIHTELLYNFLAVQLIREDEPIDTFSHDLQDEKVRQFKIEVAAGNSYFFFQQPELNLVTKLLKMSPEEWSHAWLESLIQQESLNEIVEYLKSEN